jgi:hypothetical protein
LSGFPPAEIREKARKVLESMRGLYKIWNLDITGVKKKDSNFVIVGNYTEEMFSRSRVYFEITIDKDGNVLEARLTH